MGKMASKVTTIIVLLIFATSLFVIKEVQAMKSKSKSRSQSSRSETVDFPCLDNELESCRLKRKTFNRLRVSLDDLQNTSSQGECQDTCESTVGKRGKRLEQCLCLCNYYSVCLESIGSGTAEGSGVESTKTKSKSKSTKSKKSRSKSGGSGELVEDEDTSSKSKKKSKSKGPKSKQ